LSESNPSPQPPPNKKIPHPNPPQAWGAKAPPLHAWRGGRGERDFEGRRRK